METSLNQRLELFFKESGIANNEIAKLTNVNKTTVSNWVTGFAQIPVKHLIIIMNAYKNLNARWLLTGEGEMLDSLPKIDKNDESSQITKGKVELLMVQLREKQLENATLLKEIGRLEERLESRKK